MQYRTQGHYSFFTNKVANVLTTDQDCKIFCWKLFADAFNVDLWFHAQEQTNIHDCSNFVETSEVVNFSKVNELIIGILILLI